MTETYRTSTDSNQKKKGNMMLIKPYTVHNTNCFWQFPSHTPVRWYTEISAYIQNITLIEFTAVDHSRRIRRPLAVIRSIVHDVTEPLWCVRCKQYSKISTLTLPSDSKSCGALKVMIGAAIGGKPDKPNKKSRKTITDSYSLLREDCVWSA